MKRSMMLALLCLSLSFTTNAQNGFKMFIPAKYGPYTSGLPHIQYRHDANERVTLILSAYKTGGIKIIVSDYSAGENPVEVDQISLLRDSSVGNTYTAISTVMKKFKYKATGELEDATEVSPVTSEIFDTLKEKIYLMLYKE